MLVSGPCRLTAARPTGLATPSAPLLQGDTGIEPFWTKILQALRQLAHHAASGLLDALFKWRFEAGSERESGSTLGLTGGSEGRQLRKKVTVSAGMDDGTKLISTAHQGWHAVSDTTCMSPQQQSSGAAWRLPWR